MSLFLKDNKYFCSHREFCPYRYCPWNHKGVNVNKTDFSRYQEERYKQNWFHLPENNDDAEFCCAHMDI